MLSIDMEIKDLPPASTLLERKNAEVESLFSVAKLRLIWTK